MSRTTKPIQLYEALGNPNRLTKAEIGRRKSSEMEIKNHMLRPSYYVKQDKRALKEFRRLKKLYKEIEFIGSLDEHIINQYCLSVSELDDLVMVLNTARASLINAHVRAMGTAEQSVYEKRGMRSLL